MTKSIRPCTCCKEFFDIESHDAHVGGNDPESFDFENDWCGRCNVSACWCSEEADLL